MSDPTYSDIDFKNEMAWVRTTLNSYAILFDIFVQLWYFKAQCGVGNGAEITLVKQTNFFEKNKKNSWLKEGLKKGLKAVDFV